MLLKKGIWYSWLPMDQNKVPFKKHFIDFCALSIDVQYISRLDT